MMSNVMQEVLRRIARAYGRLGWRPCGSPSKLASPVRVRRGLDEVYLLRTSIWHFERICRPSAADNAPKFWRWGARTVRLPPPPPSNLLYRAEFVISVESASPLLPRSNTGTG